MLSKNDIQILRGMFEENTHVLKREIRDEMRALLLASETKVIHRLATKIEHIKEEIVDGIIDTLDRDIYPRLHGHDQEIMKLNLHIGLA